VAPRRHPLICPTTPTPSAWDGELAAHRRRATPQQPAGTAAQAAEARLRAIKQTNDEDDGPQTYRWSGGGPRGRGHAPRAQERYSPTAEYHARTIVWLEARVLEQAEEDDDGPQTARWSGGGPGHGQGHAPRAYGRTSPDRGPPTAERYAQVMARIDAEYPQTARRSGSGPSRGRGGSP
jgi:hypothetical protein